MKEEEEIAQAYLHTISNDVVLWPDGRNVPPDFKLNQIIAVEVRRFSKNIINKNTELCL
jgi:frataxin-like iron-binding protein CyaY